MLLKILSKIPLLQCLTGFPYEAHKNAFKKFWVLLTLTSLPVIAACLLSPIPDGDASTFSKLLLRVQEAMSVSELFVYTALFLTPTLYLIYEKYSNVPREELAPRIVQGFKGIFQGYGLVAFLSFLTICSAALAFGSLKTDPLAFERTFLGHYLIEYSFSIYLFSLFCWYLSILDGVWSDDFVTTTRNQENKTSDQFSKRISNRGDK